MKNVKMFILLVLIIPAVMAGPKCTLSGFIKDANSGELLIGAAIYIKELNTGTTSNVYGFYSLTVPCGNYHIFCSYLGYTNDSLILNIHSDSMMHFCLKPKTSLLNEVVISTKYNSDNVKKPEMGVTKLSMNEINEIPVLFGERDVLKTIQLLPGVKSAGEGNSGFYVRGGGADQNLIILDEAPVYNASHLLGFFSVFNSDAIKDVKLIKGGMPAEYGGRLSSVLDIRINEGNQKEYDVSGGVGLISSRLKIEGQIVKEKSSFLISGRRTYADLFLKLSSNESQRNTQLYFYDLNAKINYFFNDKNKIFLSGYFGRDVFNFNDLIGVGWGNATGTFRWNHIFGKKVFVNTSAIYSSFDYNVGINRGDAKADIFSGINNINIKQDYQWYINSGSTVKWGGNAIHHTFKPGELKSDASSFINSRILDEKYAIEWAVYGLGEQKINSRININYGLRFTDFNMLGPGEIYSYNADGNITDTSTFQSGELIQNYNGWEPRLTVQYSVNEISSLKASFTRNYQFIHLLSNSTASAPTDLWLPSSNLIKPQLADQIAIGYFRNFQQNRFESALELYYKNLENQIDYKNGADILLNEKVESQLVFGKGRAYGAELFVKKKSGKWNGWVGYTFSITERSFSAIGNGEWFPAKYDRTHDFSLVSMYNISPKWNIAATWVYYTGNAVTFPSGKYYIDGILTNYYTERNGYRMPDYHRLDLSANYKPEKKRKFESSWNFSIYNVYARKNAYSITFRESETNPGKTEAVRLSLFSIVPSITYNFKF